MSHSTHFCPVFNFALNIVCAQKTIVFGALFMYLCIIYLCIHSFIWVSEKVHLTMIQQKRKSTRPLSPSTLCGGRYQKKKKKTTKRRQTTSHDPSTILDSVVSSIIRCCLQNHPYIAFSLMP